VADSVQDERGAVYCCAVVGVPAPPDAAPRTEAMRLKIVLMLSETPGSNAPAATAMKPASNAYSTMSCALRSFSKRVMSSWSLSMVGSQLIVQPLC
jgi:hypothetical protein